jgi:hypothetical protein
MSKRAKAKPVKFGKTSNEIQSGFKSEKRPAVFHPAFYQFMQFHKKSCL